VESYNWQLFLNDRNITPQGLLANRGISVLNVTRNGNVLWILHDRDAWRNRLMMNERDVGAQLFGDRTYTWSYYPMVSETGDVFWRGGIDGEYFGIFLNDRDIKPLTIGETHSINIPRGMDAYGHALWGGSGSLTNDINHVFVNDFDLSADALGRLHSLPAAALAIGKEGHVLWYSLNPNGLMTLWLSTPIPEPGGGVGLGVAALVLACRRRKRRGTG
jgi:hypothetical protein